ncbi:MAG: ABC transporter ATP-binding protein, partial [Bdellovibrionales bacterium]|nr:ABC transporter ATP-binding protein [Bdellovibrionales bacterium]
SFQHTLYALMMLAVYLGILIYLSWKLSLIVLTIFPLLHLLFTRLMKQIHSVSHLQTREFTIASGKLTNALTIIPLIKAYNNEKRELEHLSHISDQIESLEFSMDKKTNSVYPIQELVSLCYLLLLVILIGVFIKIDNNAHIANYSVFLFVLMRTSRLFGVFNSFRTTIAECSGPLQELSSLFDDRDKFFIADGSIEFTRLKDTVRCENLSYTFPGGVSALSDCTCSFLSGKTTALVGESGAGKSTILNLLMRFYEPPRGQIFIDDIDINDFSIASWRDRIALISQDALLFHDTLRENLLYGLSRDVSEQELQQILSESKLRSLVDSLPDGLETLIGDRGVKLSGGEKQRISIARALLKQADILFLDEATSSLDSKTEREIQASLDSLIQGKTTIVIAHRLSTIRNADHIIVIESGHIVEQGTLDDLLDKKGRFFEYWEEQRF